MTTHGDSSDNQLSISIGVPDAVLAPNPLRFQLNDSCLNDCFTLRKEALIERLLAF